MKLDNEEQRKFLLQLLDMATFPGAVRHKVYALGVAVETAEILTEILGETQSPIGEKSTSL